MVPRRVDNYQDILDSRDVIARQEELQQELDDLEAEAADDTNVVRDEAIEQLKVWKEENQQELDALNLFVEEGNAEWRHGETLVRESYFEDYARQLAEEVGAISGEEKWPLTCIDWEQAAEELKQDYTSADFDGVTYYYLA